MPAGDIYGDGAPTGIAYYENGALDSQYPSGLLLSCESARGVVFGYVPETQGAGFSLQRFDFLKLKANSANGGWFRPSDVAVGPDGAIYVSDWFDPGVGGHRMNDRPEADQFIESLPRRFAQSFQKFDLSTAEGSIQALCHPSPNVRSQGFFKLQQLGANALPQVKQLLQNTNRFLAARAVWLLPSLGDEGIQLAKTFLQAEPENSVSPELKIATIRSLKRAGVSCTEHFQSLSKDPSVAVRRELALVLRDVPWPQKKQLITSLAAGFDGWDRWYLEAMGIACEGNEAEAFSLLVGESDPMKWDRPAAQLAWRLHPPAAVAGLRLRAMNHELTRPQRKQMIDAIGFVSTKAANEAMLEIATSGPEDLRAHASWVGPQCRESSMA